MGNEQKEQHEFVDADLGTATHDPNCKVCKTPREFYIVPQDNMDDICSARNWANGSVKSNHQDQFVRFIEYSAYLAAISRAERAERKLEAAELKIMWLKEQRNLYLGALCAAKGISDEDLNKKVQDDDEFLKRADKKLEAAEGEK